MTAQATRDALAEMDGWNKPGILYTEEGVGDDYPRDMTRKSVSRTHWWRIAPSGEFQYMLGDPHPPTLDGADSSMPDGVYWERAIGEWFAYASSVPRDALAKPFVRVPDTGDKIADLYALALACRKAMEEKV